MKNKYWPNCKLEKPVNKSIPKNHYPDDASFIFLGICYCEHKSILHVLDNNECSQEWYKYRSFFP